MSTSEAAEEDITDPHETRFSVDTSMEDTSDVLGEHRVNERVSSSSLTHEEPVSGRRTTTLLLSPSRKSKRILTRKKTRGSPKYLRDAITVEIPLSVTADFKIAIQRTRSKRVQSIYKAFPILKKLLKKPSQRGGDEDDDDDEDDSKADDPMDGEDATSNKDPTDEKENNGKPSRRKKKKILPHVPQPEQYGSVLDYLEAKYVRGVMLVDDEGGDGSMGGDGSEGAGSIYSGGSFLDDTDLQRDVAEQVLANTTLTKLELEHEDGEFFVNVGNLEVEENQYGEDYDPIQDKDVVKATKKRRRVVQPANPEATKPTTAAKMKKTVKEEKKDTSAQSTTSKKSIASTGSQKKKLPVLEKKADSEKKVAPAKKVAPEKKVVPEKKLDPEKKPVDDEPTTTIITDSKTLAANEAKKKSDGLFNDLAAEIKKMTKEELPRRKKNLTVSLTCPPNKNPGDTVTFTNPLNKEQRLRAKIPKNVTAGGTFRASVPLPKDQIEESPDTDSNKLSRVFQELADDYARAYDIWCGLYAETDKSFSLLKEKRNKWESVIKLFPKDLLTPVDAEYMSKILRRARQNRKKRQKTAEKMFGSGTAAATTTTSTEHKEADEKQSDIEDDNKDDEPSVDPHTTNQSSDVET